MVEASCGKLAFEDPKIPSYSGGSMLTSFIETLSLHFRNTTQDYEKHFKNVL
jgi:hypothetical protein